MGRQDPVAPKVSERLTSRKKCSRAKCLCLLSLSKSTIWKDDDRCNPLKTLDAGALSLSSS
jgi:hypothetical protein